MGYTGFSLEENSRALLPEGAGDAEGRQAFAARRSAEFFMEPV
jgi:hypothetical protein